MSKKKKKVQIYYTSIGDHIDPGVAYCQAASLLDLAAFTAVECGSVDQMESVAHHWMEMAALMTGEKSEEQNEDIPAKTTVLGFGSTKAREVAERARKSKS
jgi:hypothetical protein